jgi:hypothetical protein
MVRSPGPHSAFQSFLAGCLSVHDFCCDSFQQSFYSTLTGCLFRGRPCHSYGSLLNSSSNKAKFQSTSPLLSFVLITPINAYPKTKPLRMSGASPEKNGLCSSVALQGKRVQLPPKALHDGQIVIFWSILDKPVRSRELIPVRIANPFQFVFFFILFGPGLGGKFS